MNGMKALAALVLAFALVGCTAPPPGSAASGGETSGGDDGEGIWTYATGPNGERCLFYQQGSGHNVRMGMDCQWPEQ